MGHLALADEPPPATFTVISVAAATLRAEPDGSSLALAIVPAGSVVSAVGPDAVTAGVTWRQVRTFDGDVGYLPAGLLAPVGGGAAPSDIVGSQIASRPAAAPVQSVGAAPAQSVGAQVDPPPPGAPVVPADPVPAGVAAPNAVRQPTPSRAPTPPTVRTTVERRRGRNVTISHIDKATAPNGREMGAGRIVVRFTPGASPQGRAAAHRAAGTVSTRNARLADVMVAQVDPGAVQQALTAYRSRSDVAWAEPDYIVRATLATSDPRFGDQWGPTKIGAPTAWDVTTGAASTLVAILDTGIFTESSTFTETPDGLPGHPDLRGKVALEQNFSLAFDTDDWYGHGTLMAGIAAARTNTTPALGIAGVGFDVRLLNGKVLDDNGEGFESDVAEGIVWAADNGARVINMSLSAPGACSPTLQAAVDYAWARNVVLVAAAGNGGTDLVGDPAPESPANCTHMLPIGAIDRNDARPNYSNFGPGVPLAAPGGDNSPPAEFNPNHVLSTDNAGGYATVSGTSPSTAHVAGVAALLVSTPHGATNQSIALRLLHTADPVVGTGTLWGFGRVNAAAAVGPASCSPRPQVSISSTPGGGALNVTVTTTGVGNAVRFIQTGAVAGTTLNALVGFPTPSSEATGTKTYVPRTVGATAAFQVQREVGGSPTTLPFIVMDGCGPWQSFVGGGTGAGF